jgi:hypothetical protein
MRVFTRAYANFARAIPRATTNCSAGSFARRKSRRSSSRKSGSSCSRESGRSSSRESGRSSSGESRRTGSDADGKRAPRVSGGTGRARRYHYRHLKPSTD